MLELSPLKKRSKKIEETLTPWTLQAFRTGGTDEI